MNKKLLIATHNPAKLAELKLLLAGLPLEVITLGDLGITEDVEEDGQTYVENSQKKALFYAQKTGLPAVGDDGGIEIVALNNQPGIHSRRWLGYSATDEELIAHMRKIARELPDDNRDAFFKTVISFALPSGHVWSVKGDIKGLITKEPSLKIMEGFPYRSFFFLPEINKYYFENELTEEEMKQYNHRRRAFDKLKPLLIEQLGLV